MILVKNEMISMKGAKSEIEAETVEILNALYRHGSTKEDLLELVELATMSEAELHKKFMEVVERKISKINE